MISRFQFEPNSLCFLNDKHKVIALSVRGWSGGAMVLGKLPVPGRPTNLD